MRLIKRMFFIFLIFQLVLTNCNIQAQTNGTEIAYLHTDRTAYIAGESIHFKLYVLDAVSKKRSEVSKVGYVVLRTVNSEPSLKIRVKVDAGKGSGSVVLPDTLQSGIYQILAYTSAMKNQGEDRFFRKQITIVNRFDKALDFKIIGSTIKDSSLTQVSGGTAKISVDKSVYRSREKVIVRLGKLDLKANVSVSVFEIPKIPSTYKTIGESITDLSVNKNDKKARTYYSPETKGKILRGVVVDSKTQQPIKDAIVLLSCVDTIPNLQYAVTNADGLFQLLLSDYYNGKELYLTIKDTPDRSKWQIKVENEFAQPERWNPSLIADNSNYKDYIVKSQNIVYINKSYQIDKENTYKPKIESESICPRFYNCPVETILPSDFMPLPDFLEIAVEIIPRVRIVKENNNYKVQIVNELTNEFNKNSPAIFLDGVFVDDVNKIIQLGTEQIKKIEIIEAERAFGDLVFSGVISITTFKNEIESSMPASHSVRVINDNENSGANFIPLNPDTHQSNSTPFVKQLLYWNPNLELSGTNDTSFEFYTSDNLAKYIIKVEGISEDGTPISATSSFQVTNPINNTDK